MEVVEIGGKNSSKKLIRLTSVNALVSPTSKSVSWRNSDFQKSMSLTLSPMFLLECAWSRLVSWSFSWTKRYVSARSRSEAFRYVFEVAKWFWLRRCQSSGVYLRKGDEMVSERVAPIVVPARVITGGA